MTGLDDLGIRHPEQYAGVWAMDEAMFRQQLSHIETINLANHVAIQARTPPGETIGAYEKTADGVAVVSLVGTMTKYGSSLSALPFGTVGVRRSLRNALRDPQVKAIMLVVDSPGGNIAGTGDLADEVARAAQQKHITAYIEDLGASAAYWVASQATEVIANSSAFVGSIGTYMVIQDFSVQAEQMGVKVHVIRAGEFKGAAVPGTEVTDAQLAEFQRVVDSVNGLFVAGVARGRALDADTATALADGRVHIAAEAALLGLIDDVGTFDDAMNALRTRVEISETRRAQSTAKLEEKAMSDDVKKAEYTDLAVLCVGADNDFICAQLGKGATADQAQSAWMERQNATIETLTATVAAKDEEIAALKTVGGNKPLGNGDSIEAETPPDPVARWRELVVEAQKTSKTKADAVSRVDKQNPGLRAAYLEAHNVEASQARG